MTFQFRHRWARRAIAALLIVLGVLFVGPMLVPSGIIAKRLAAAVERATGRKLAINGGVTLWLLPRPGAAAERVSFSNAAWETTKPMLSIALVEVDLRLLPLLLGRIELENVDIEAPTLNLDVNSEGQRNWTFVRETPASRSALPAEISQPVATSAVPSSPATLAGPETPMPSPAAVPPPTAPLTTQLAWLVPHALQIANGIVTYSNVATGERYRLSGVNLALAAEAGTQAHALIADGTFKSAGNSVNATLRIKDWTEMLAGRRSDFSASVISSIAQLDISGNGTIVGPAVEAAIALRITPQGEETPRLLARVGSLSVAAHVAIAEKKLTLTELTMEHDGVAVGARGQVSAELIGSHPAVSGYLEFGRLDLDPLLPPPRQEDEPSVVLTPAPILAKSPPRDWPDTPLKLAPLHSWQGDLTLKGGPIIVRGIEIGPSVFRLSLANGHAKAELQEAAVGNGHLQFSAEIESAEADTVDARVQLSAKSIPVDALMSFGRRSLRAGSISAEGMIESHGVSQRSLIGNLAGQLRISVDDGSFGLARIFERIRVINTSCPSYADHGSANAEIRIREGIVALTTANLRAAPLDLAATGSIDLPQRHVALRLANGRISCAPDGLLEGPWNDPSFASEGG